MKLAFCFLSYKDIEHHHVWTYFFERAPRHQYAIYLHRSDGQEESILPGCIVIPTIKTEWGTFSLLQAQQNLFNEAIKDTEVTKCMLLSGDSIPLYTFATIYQRMIQDNKGYMQPIAATSKFAFKSDAWPADRIWDGKYNSQWVTLTRMHIQMLQENWEMLGNVFKDAYIPDEFMYYIFFNGFGCIDTFHMEPYIYINYATTPTPCSIKHHARPLTYHSNNFTPIHVQQIYATKCLFLRKVCSQTVVRMDWSKPQPLRNNGANGLIHMTRRRM